MPDQSQTDASSVEPVVFRMPIDVTDEHVDAPGHHVNNIVYVRWVQQVATAHWQSVATPEQQASVVWFVVRHEIDYLKEVFVGESLVASTHIGEARGARLERFVEIVREDGTTVARARSVWAAISARNGRPTRVTGEMLAGFTWPRMAQALPVP